MEEEEARKRRKVAPRAAKAVFRMGPVSAEQCRRIIAEADAPIVFEGMLSKWPALKWSPETFRVRQRPVAPATAVVAGGGLSEATATHGRGGEEGRGGDSGKGVLPGAAKCSFGIRPHDTAGIPWEGLCEYRTATLSEFVSWDTLPNKDAELQGRQEKGHANSSNDQGSDGELDADNAFQGISPATHWCYASYKRMAELFVNENADLVDELDWTRFGVTTAAAESTFWFGSAGATTPCHYDTYGTNIVAQLHGRKRWTLAPPSDHAGMYATRIPYEESSVYSAVDVGTPDYAAHPMFSTVSTQIVELGPGDALFVPRHWWHYVETIETAIAVNIWSPHEKDADERISEALVRTLVCALHRGNASGSSSNDVGGVGTATTMPPVGGVGASNPQQQQQQHGQPQLDWLNPTEECVSQEQDVAMVTMATQLAQQEKAKGKRKPPEQEPMTFPAAFSDVVAAFTSPAVVEAARLALLQRTGNPLV